MSQNDPGTHSPRLPFFNNLCCKMSNSGLSIWRIEPDIAMPFFCQSIIINSKIFSGLNGFIG